MMTDFDYFENEIKKCRERIAKAGSGDIKEKQKRDQLGGGNQLFEQSPAASADVIALRRDCQRAIDICAAMLKFAKEKHAENVEREE
jgi:hypothetical protein